MDSESVIMDTVHKLAESKTVIVISHRLANIEKADKIYVLADGRVAESGTHQKLLENGGMYSQMYLTQKSLEEVDINE